VKPTPFACAREGRTVLVSSHLLAEVAQTVDAVVIIDRGHLVAQATLQELTSKEGDVVRVRTPRPEDLKTAVAATTQAEANVTANDEVQVTGVGTERIRAIADDLMIPILVMTRESTSLEDIFLRLTGDESPQGGHPMIKLVRIELLKIRTTRTPIALLGAAAVITALITTLDAARAGGKFTPPLSTAAGLSFVVTINGFALLMAFVLGVIVSGGELAHGTATATYLGCPKRGRVLAAKTIASLVVGMFFGAVGAATSLAAPLRRGGRPDGRPCRIRVRACEPNHCCPRYRLNAPRPVSSYPSLEKESARLA
jgi:hypothetical protein